MCKENRDLHFGEDFLFSYSFNLVTFAFIQLSFSILVLIRTKAMSEGLVFSLISSLTRAWLSRCLFFNLHMFLCILKPIHVVGVIGFNRCWGSRNWNKHNPSNADRTIRFLSYWVDKLVPYDVRKLREWIGSLYRIWISLEFCSICWISFVKLLNINLLCMADFSLQILVLFDGLILFLCLFSI